MAVFYKGVDGCGPLAAFCGDALVGVGVITDWLHRPIGDTFTAIAQSASVFSILYAS
jgi:hypothetical protein